MRRGRSVVDAVALRRSVRAVVAKEREAPMVATTRQAQSGFTLTELMVVVVIMAILAGIAYPTYMHQQRRAQAVEASETLTRVVQAQESYRAEFTTYADVSNDLSLGGVNAGTTGILGNNWHPALGAPRSAPSGRIDFYINLPRAWSQIGVRPRQYVRYSYQTVAGNPGVIPALAAAGDLGYGALPIAQRGPWYYAIGSGDLDGDSTFSTFEVSSLFPGIRITRETE